MRSQSDSEPVNRRRSSRGGGVVGGGWWMFWLDDCLHATAAAAGGEHTMTSGRGGKIGAIFSIRVRGKEVLVGDGTKHKI